MAAVAAVGTVAEGMEGAQEEDMAAAAEATEVGGTAVRAGPGTAVVLDTAAAAAAAMAAAAAAEAAATV